VIDSKVDIETPESTHLNLSIKHKDSHNLKDPKDPKDPKDNKDKDKDEQNFEEQLNKLKNMRD